MHILIYLIIFRGPPIKMRIMRASTSQKMKLTKEKSNFAKINKLSRFKERSKLKLSKHQVKEIKVNISKIKLITLSKILKTRSKLKFREFRSKFSLLCCCKFKLQSSFGTLILVLVKRCQINIDRFINLFIDCIELILHEREWDWEWEWYTSITPLFSWTCLFLKDAYGCFSTHTGCRSMYDLSTWLWRWYWRGYWRGRGTMERGSTCHNVSALVDMCQGETNANTCNQRIQEASTNDHYLQILNQLLILAVTSFEYGFYVQTNANTTVANVYDQYQHHKLSEWLHVFTSPGSTLYCGYLHASPTFQFMNQSAAR